MFFCRQCYINSFTKNNINNLIAAVHKSQWFFASFVNMGSMHLTVHRLEATCQLFLTFFPKRCHQRFLLVLQHKTRDSWRPQTMPRLVLRKQGNLVHGKGECRGGSGGDGWILVAETGARSPSPHLHPVSPLPCPWIYISCRAAIDPRRDTGQQETSTDVSPFPSQHAACLHNMAAV